MIDYPLVTIELATGMIYGGVVDLADPPSPDMAHDGEVPTKDTLLDKITDLVRQKQCKACDDYDCDCSGKTPEDVADEIMKQIAETMPFDDWE